MLWLRKNQTWVFSGIGVTILTIVGGFIWKNISPEKEAINSATADNNSTVVQIGGNASNVTVNADKKKDLRKFKKFVPKTYLANLPKVKYNAYIEARKYWDTGITSEMLRGTNILYDRLFKILIDLSGTAYTEDFFEGQSTTEYYSSKISRFMSSSYESQPTDSGSMHTVMAHGEMSEIADEFVIKIVKDVTDESYFPVWKKKWDRASELGAKGEEVDLDLTNEL